MTNYEKLRTALKQIATLWPEPGMCAEVNPEWVGENDGKQRAILLEAALNISRAALKETERFPLPAPSTPHYAVFDNKEEMLEFLDGLDGCGLIVTDEDKLSDTLDNIP